MYKDICVEELLQKVPDISLVDLRSPAEYHQSTIPGAYNIPLLGNIERSLVGIAYQQQGPEIARKMALDIVAPRLPSLMESFKRVAVNKEIMIFCWRGGDRSHFTGCLLDAMGYRVYRLIGGYKAFRKSDFQFFDRERLPLKAVVLHGLTGVGKTDILLELKQRGYPVLDLEGLANHRGSVFGKIGQPPSPSQKMFESLLAKDIKQAQNRGFFIVECESRRIGHLYVPNAIMETMSAGINVLVYAALDSRIRRIKRDYGNKKEHDFQALEKAIHHLNKYIGLEKAEELKGQLKRSEIETVIEFLLLNYYDPLYKYPDKANDLFHLSLENRHVEQAAAQIAEFLSSIEFTRQRGEV